MKAPSLLVACCFVLCSTLLLTLPPLPGSRHRRSARTPPPHQRLRPSNAGASPATPCNEAFARFSIGSRTVWAETGARAPTATCRPTASSSRRRASRRDSSSCSGGGASIRMPTIRCFGRSMPTISGPTATPPAISAIFARTLSSGSRSRCRRTSGSSIPRPTRCRTRHLSTCGAWCRPSTTSP